MELRSREQAEQILSETQAKLKQVEDYLRNNPEIIKYAWNEIDSFEKACFNLGLNPYYLLKKWEGLAKDTIAYEKLKIIVKAINGNWVADYNNKEQKKYYPYFKYKSNGTELGFSFSNDDYFFSRKSSYLGSRLCLERIDKAKYIGRVFEKEYNEFFL